MRSWWTAGVLGMLCLPGLATSAPLTFQHSGRLLDTTGGPLSGVHTLGVTLYDSGGTAVWQQAYAGQDLQQGYYAVVLGTDATGRTLEQATAGASAAVEVGLTIDGGAELTPRAAFHAVPRAATADAVAVAASLTGAACPAMGAVAYDSTAAALVV